jgi:hypothetical protein
MQSQETQEKKTENNNVSLVDNTPDYINPQESGKSEPLTQVQKDSVITNRDLPNPLFRYAFTAVIVGSFLFVVAIYYGIINP